MTLRRIVEKGFALSLMLLGITILARPYWLDYNRRAMTHGIIAQVMPPVESFPETAADRAVHAVVAAMGDREALRAKTLSLVTPELERPGTGTLMNGHHRIDSVREAVKRLGAEIRAAFETGRADEALRLFEATDRLTRIYGRGFSNTPFPDVKRDAALARAQLDQDVEATLKAGSVPARALPRLLALYDEGLVRDTGLDKAVLSELDLIERCVRKFDENHGVLRYLDCGYNGDGVAQVRRLRADWIAGRRPIHTGALENVHYMVQMILSDNTSILENDRHCRGIRKAVRAAIAARLSTKA